MLFVVPVSSEIRVGAGDAGMSGLQEGCRDLVFLFAPAEILHGAGRQWCFSAVTQQELHRCLIGKLRRITGCFPSNFCSFPVKCIWCNRMISCCISAKPLTKPQGFCNNWIHLSSVWECPKQAQRAESKHSLAWPAVYPTYSCSPKALSRTEVLALGRLQRVRFPAGKWESWNCLSCW